jgi:hypothetical protein
MKAATTQFPLPLREGARGRGRSHTIPTTALSR